MRVHIKPTLRRALQKDKEPGSLMTTLLLDQPTTEPVLHLHFKICASKFHYGLSQCEQVSSLFTVGKKNPDENNASLNHSIIITTIYPSICSVVIIG